MALGRVGSAVKAKAVVPSDSTIITFGCRALYVGGSGNLAVILAEDYDPASPTANSVTFANVPAGSVLPIAVVKVLAATSATNILALG